jgi:hypothetical protein
MFERETTPPVFTEKAPFCQAVVAVAAEAGCESPKATVRSEAVMAVAVLAANKRKGRRALKGGPPVRGGCYGR